MKNYFARIERIGVDQAIERATKRLQEIQISSAPLATKRVQVDAQMVMLLENILPLLSKGRQHEIRACLTLHETIWFSDRTSLPSTQTDGSLSSSQAD